MSNVAKTQTEQQISKASAKFHAQRAHQLYDSLPRLSPSEITTFTWKEMFLSLLLMCGFGASAGLMGTLTYWGCQWLAKNVFTLVVVR